VERDALPELKTEEQVKWQNAKRRNKAKVKAGRTMQIANGKNRANVLLRWTFAVFRGFAFCDLPFAF
jgi:hypothetical protein